MKAIIKQVFDADILTNEEKIVVHEFYGFNGQEKSLDEIKSILKCRKSEVEKLLKSAIKKLKVFISEKSEKGEKSHVSQT